MPNWVENNVTVSGTKKDIDDFFSKYFDDEGCIDFTKIIPEPNTKDECPKKYICDCKEANIEDTKGGNWFNWYDFHCDKWGVKWNACDGYIYKDGNFFFFLTPWGIPTGIFKKLIELYPNLTFEVDVDGEIDEPFSIVYSKDIIYGQKKKIYIS